MIEKTAGSQYIGERANHLVPRAEEFDLAKQCFATVDHLTLMPNYGWTS